MHLSVVNSFLVLQLGARRRAVASGVVEIHQQYRRALDMLRILAQGRRIGVHHALWQVRGQALARLNQCLDQALKLAVLLCIRPEPDQLAIFDTLRVWETEHNGPMLSE